MGTLTNPFYFARRSLSDGIRSVVNHASGRLLDIGCGSKPYKKYFNVDCYTGLEIDTSQNLANSSFDYLYDGNKLPFDTNSYDTVFSSQVLEHVFNPSVFISEIRRVSKPNSILILTVPFIWDEHEQPFDYGRYSSFGLRKFLQFHDFEIIIQKKLCSDFSCIIQIINVYFYKIILSKLKIPRKLHFIFYSTTNLIGLLLKSIIPKSDDMYIDNLVVAKNTKK